MGNRHDRSRSPRQNPIRHDDAHEDITTVVGGLFLDNTLSALQTHRIVSSAHDGGESVLADLKKCGGSRKSKEPAQGHREEIAKKNTWPSEYYCKVPLIDKATQEQQMVEIPYILPHEVILHMVNLDPATMETFLPQHGPVAEKLKPKCKNMGLDPNMVLPIGMHGDVCLTWPR